MAVDKERAEIKHPLRRNVKPVIVEIEIRERYMVKTDRGQRHTLQLRLVVEKLDKGRHRWHVGGVGSDALYEVLMCCCDQS